MAAKRVSDLMREEMARILGHEPTESDWENKELKAEALRSVESQIPQARPIKGTATSVLPGEKPEGSEQKG